MLKKIKISCKIMQVVLKNINISYYSQLLTSAKIGK